MARSHCFCCWGLVRELRSHKPQAMGRSGKKKKEISYKAHLKAYKLHVRRDREVGSLWRKITYADFALIPSASCKQFLQFLPLFLPERLDIRAIRMTDRSLE